MARKKSAKKGIKKITLKHKEKNQCIDRDDINNEVEEQPEHCLECSHCIKEEDPRKLNRGIGGICTASIDPVIIPLSFIQDEEIANCCPLYPITREE